MVKDDEFHVPVMLKEVLEGLDLKPGNVVVDGTLGFAGHSKEILKVISPGGKLIGIDQDQDALRHARINLSAESSDIHLVHHNFVEIDQILKNLGIKNVNAILLDLGISSFQIDSPERGFSLRKEGPLDMRMDATGEFKASDIINTYTESDLADVLKNFGEERFSRRIARFIVEERKKTTIQTTTHLARIVVRALGIRGKSQKIHPATRTFQALRIVVNDELNRLALTIDRAVSLLKKQGRLAVVSFHSLEDRIVKTKFRELAKEKKMRLVTKKPLYPTEEEIRINPRSRSARLRIAERV